MPPTGNQEYTVFISYAHEDESWAKRLRLDLENKGIPKERIFLDKPSLDLGKLWQQELIAAVHGSYYFVVLWSKYARSSQWVQQEIAQFEIKINPPGAQSIKVHQRMIFISLDEDIEIFTDIQMLDDLKKENAYDAANPTIDNLLKTNPALWGEAVERVYQAITKTEDTIPIALLVVATTADRLTNDIDFSKVPDFADFTESLDDLLNKTIKIGPKPDLIARYGPERTDWKPIVGDNSDVKTLLIKLRDQINTIPNSPRIRWEPVDDTFWTDADTAISIAEKLSKRLAVIVIDPISLYDPKVYRRFNVLKENGCFDNENAVVLVLSPFSMPAPNVGFRELIKKVARQVFNDYYQPGVRKIPYARCSVNFGDDLGMTRPVLATIKHYFYQSQPRQGAIQTSLGDRG